MMMMIDPFVFGFLDSWITPSPDNLLPVDIHLAPSMSLELSLMSEAQNSMTFKYRAP